MRAYALITMLLGLVVALASLGIMRMMAEIDQLEFYELVSLEQVLRGDVLGYYVQPLLWRFVPAALVSMPLQTLLVMRAVVAMAVITTMIVYAWRRRGWELGWTAGLACLVGAALPWAMGSAMLARIESPLQCGSWLAMMIVSVFWGGVLCAAFAARQLFARKPAVAVATPQTA